MYLRLNVGRKIIGIIMGKIMGSNVVGGGRRFY